MVRLEYETLKDTCVTTSTEMYETKAFGIPVAEGKFELTNEPEVRKSDAKLKATVHNHPKVNGSPEGQSNHLSLDRPGDTVKKVADPIKRKPML